MKRLIPVVVTLLAVAAIGAAHADEAKDKPAPRPSHWGIGIGGFAAITGPADFGPAAEVEFYPGGSFGHYGLRGELRGFEDLNNGFVTLGVAFEAGASRPTLQLALHADVGVTYGDAVKPVVAAGVQWQLWFKPPFGISLDSGGYMIIDGTDSSLALMSAFTLRIAR